MGHYRKLSDGTKSDHDNDESKPMPRPAAKPRFARISKTS
jgi:hypothetical protein